MTRKPRTRPMTRVEPKNYDIIVDFASLESIRKALDRCSIFFFKCFIPNELLAREFDNYEMLKDYQYDMLNKALLALDILKQALYLHKSKNWENLDSTKINEIKSSFEYYCREFNEIAEEYARKRSKFGKTIPDIGKS